MVQLNLVLRALWNSPSIWRGYVDVPGSKLASAVESAVRQVDTIHSISLKLRQNHVLIDAEVGEMGLRYRWSCSFALRAANLNRPTGRFVMFEAAPAARVGPANWAARLTRFSVSLIPGVGPMLGFIVKALMDYLAKELVEGEVTKGADLAGVERAGNRWTVRLNDTALAEHPLFHPIELSDGSCVALVGGIVVVRSIELKDDRVRVFIDVKPELRDAMNRLRANTGRLFRLPGKGEAKAEVLADSAELPASGGACVEGPTGSKEGQKPGSLKAGGWTILGLAVPEVEIPVPKVDTLKMVEASARAYLRIVKTGHALVEDVHERVDAVGSAHEAVSDFDAAMVSNDTVFDVAGDPEWVSALNEAPLLDPLDLGLEGADLLEALNGWLELA
jgi:hypothetical protein